MQDVDCSFMSHILQTSFDRKFRFRHHCSCYVRPQSRNRIYKKPGPCSKSSAEDASWTCQLWRGHVFPRVIAFCDLTASLTPPSEATLFHLTTLGKKTARPVSPLGGCKVGGVIRTGRAQRSLAFCNSSVTVHYQQLGRRVVSCPLLFANTSAPTC